MLSVFTWVVECSLCSFVAACAGSHRGCTHKGPSLRCPRAPLSAPQCPSVLPDSPLTLGLRHHTATYWVPLASNHRREPRLWHQEETYILMSFSNLPESLHTYLVYLTPPFFSINYSSTQDKAIPHPNSSKSWTAGVPRKLLSGFIPIEGLRGAPPLAIKHLFRIPAAHPSKGTCQKRFSGFCPLRGGGPKNSICCLFLCIFSPFWNIIWPFWPIFNLI